MTREEYMELNKELASLLGEDLFKQRMDAERDELTARQYEYIYALEARIAELEATLDKAAHQLYDYSGSCPSDLYDWEHPNTCISECDIYDNPDEAWKCWRLWLLEKPKEKE